MDIREKVRNQTGLRVYPIQLGTQAPGTGKKQITPPTAEQAQERLERLLLAIMESGGEIVGFVPVDTGEEEPDVIGVRITQIIFVVVCKP